MQFLFARKKVYWLYFINMININSVKLLDYFFWYSKKIVEVVRKTFQQYIWKSHNITKDYY